MPRVNRVYVNHAVSYQCIECVQESRVDNVCSELEIRTACDDRKLVVGKRVIEKEGLKVAKKGFILSPNTLR